MSPSVSSRPRGIAARIFPSLLLLAFAGVGVLASIGMRNAAREAAVRATWPRVPAEIMRAGIAVDPARDNPFRLELEYRYRHAAAAGGTLESPVKTFTGNGGEVAEDDDYADLWLRVRDLKPGQSIDVHVNPENPSESVLNPSATGARAAAVLVPAVGVGLPLLILVAIWRPRRPGTSSGSALPLGGRIGMSLFFLPFLAAGLAVGYFLAWRQLPVLFSKHTWVETPCTVVYSRVVSHSDSDGTTYRPDVLYEYTHAGETHRSNRIGLVRSSSSGRSAKQEFVDRHPAGGQAVCFLNPRQPWIAHLEPGIGLSWLWMLFPIPFILVGAGGLAGLWVIGPLRQARLRAAAERRVLESGGDLSDPAAVASALAAVESQSAAGLPPSAADEGPAELRGGPNRLRNCLVLLLVAAFWNGIVGTFIYLIFQEKPTPWFPLVFISLFALVGLGLAWALLYAFLQLFNARFRLRLSRAYARQGEGLQVQWTMERGLFTAAPTRLQLKLVATRTTVTRTRSHSRRHGTRTSTSTKVDVLREVDLADTSVAWEIEQGQGSGLVPADVKGATEWKLKLIAEVPGWPDICDEFPLRVVKG